ncbi:MAG: FecR domain-containing protein [Ginsengibacter sp.]
MPDRRNIKDLLEKYILNTCSREDMDMLLQIIQNEKEEEAVTKILKLHWETSGKPIHGEEMNVEDKFSMLMSEIKMETPADSIDEKKTNRWYIRLAAAAVIVGLLSAGVYFIGEQDSPRQIVKTENLIKQTNNNDVLPGRNTATLTLADGTTVILDDAQNGTVTTQGNTKVIKLNNGMLSYKSLHQKTAEIVYNTILTPKGGQYQLILSDGSKVWLNAASSLRFPADFTAKERKVELLGEAYFEVAKNTARPFKVVTEGMEVEVLGTHFNVNSYDDESSTRTTLLEGIVKISHGTNTDFLKPGQQAKLTRDGNLKIINNADLDESVAWKEGKFQFDRADIHEVMRQIARWYDVSVDYKGIVSSHFGGSISRDVNLSQVLKMLEMTSNLKFQIEDQHVVVGP